MVDTHKVRELALYTENDYNTHKTILEPTYKNFARRKEKGNYDKELAKKQIANNIYKVARENYKKELGFDLQLNPKERELYANELYEGINEQSDEERKKLYSNKNVNKNSGSVTTVKPHNRKGTKGVRGHYRKTKSSDLI